MDRRDVSIENVAEQFLVEGSEIENRDDPILLMTIFLLQSILHMIFCIVLIKTNSIIIMRKMKRKKKPQSKDDFSSKEKDGQSKGKINKELYNLESDIKQGKSPSEIYKANLVILPKSTIFERCKRYKVDSSFERKSGSGRIPSILMSIFNKF